MDTSAITISSAIPMELYDKLVLHAHDIGVDKDTVIQNALKQYLRRNGDTYLFGDYERPAPDYMASGKVETIPTAP